MVQRNGESGFVRRKFRKEYGIHQWIEVYFRIELNEKENSKNQENEKENSKNQEKDKKIKDLDRGALSYLGSLYDDMGIFRKLKNFTWNLCKFDKISLVKTHSDGNLEYIFGRNFSK